jgi:putative transposase
MNRTENSHQPTRQRAAQLFLSVFSANSPHFRPRRHLLTATGHRPRMTARFTVRNAIAGLPATT